MLFHRLPNYRTLERAVVLLTTLLAVAQVTAIGIVVPRIPDLAPPQLQSVDVKAQIVDHIARTRITQVYRNPNSRPVEADFFFPVPMGADITDFVLYMDGKPVKGEVLDKEKAHEIYRDIVRKLKDPGLVEWADKNLFRVRIFPIPANGEQKFEIEVSQPLTADQGYFRYFLPLDGNRHKKSGAPPLATFNISLKADTPLRNVYSPTHQIDTDSSQSKSIVVKADAPISRAENFTLYYEASASDIAASLLTHRDGSEDGYFSLRIAPPWEATTATKSNGGDYVFVIDTSGSMAEGDKILQAKKALKYCISLLKDNDRFNLVRFSTTVEPYKDTLVQATEAYQKSAVAWIDQLEARGGTNISEALKKALAQKSAGATTSSESMFTVVFLTDGLPTVGETSPESIAKAVEQESGGNVRVFTFGVGYDVNTRLLDSIAQETRAASDYVAPEADLEVPVSRFFDKVSRPALFNVELQLPEAGIKEVYPPQLPDLFYGTELSVYGKYSNATSATIILTGTIAGEKKEFLFQKNFPQKAENNFIEKLWATRKVAWLLDQVRKAGESSELRTEIEELARKYSIVTPYTSYLAMEDDKVIQERRGGAIPAAPPHVWHDHGISTTGRALFGRDSSVPASAAAPARVLQEQSGEGAVQNALQLRQMKSADQVTASAEPATSGRKTIGKKTFVLENGRWKDTAFTGSEQIVIKIKYLSEAWFQVSETFPEIREVFSLGEQVSLRVNQKIAIQISAEGTDTIDDSTIDEISKALEDNI